MSDGSGALASARRAVPQSGRFSVTDQIVVSLLWFALFANWLTVVPVIVPDQIIVDPRPERGGEGGDQRLDPGDRRVYGAGHGTGRGGAL